MNYLPFALPETGEEEIAEATDTSSALICGGMVFNEAFQTDLIVENKEDLLCYQ